jgi:hypothetical protein
VGLLLINHELLLLKIPFILIYICCIIDVPIGGATPEVVPPPPLPFPPPAAYQYNWLPYPPPNQIPFDPQHNPSLMMYYQQQMRMFQDMYMATMYHHAPIPPPTATCQLPMRELVHYTPHPSHPPSSHESNTPTATANGGGASSGHLHPAVVSTSNDDLLVINETGSKQQKLLQQDITITTTAITSTSSSKPNQAIPIIDDDTPN